MSCEACRKVCTPTSCASLGRSRVMIWSAVALRPASLGFRAMNMLAWLALEPPTNMPTPATPGSWPNDLGDLLHFLFGLGEGGVLRGDHHAAEKAGVLLRERSRSRTVA